MDKQYKYDAFISYRHTEHDKTIAAKLQKMLETYKPPKAVCKDFKQWHIFRDETELPTSSNLSGDIKDALESSRFLIVVCSKSTKESRWCMEEITYFKELHKGNNSNIITLIVDGEPSEVFPEELCNEMIEVSDADGNISYQSHVIEPLAANVSAETTKESLKKLKTEFLRIAAPLLGCGYDTLYNRNQKRHVRRIIIIAALIMTFLFAFGLYTSAMLLEINAQKSALQVANDNLRIKTEELDKSNRELQETNASLEQKTKEAQDNLEEANKQKTVAENNLAEAERQRKIAENNLAEANRQKKIAEDNLAEANRQQKIAQENAEEAERQKNTAEQNMLIAQENEARANEQTRLAQIENSENLSVLSENLWNSGDGVEAIQTVLSALPQDGENRPVVPDAERILAQEIGAYNQETFSPVLKVSHNKPVDINGYVGDGSTLVTQDETGVYMWNAHTGELVTKFPAEKFGTYLVDVKTEDNGEIETSSLSKISGSSFIMDQHSILGYKKDSTNESNTAGNDFYIYSENSQICKVDGKTGEIIWEIADKKDHWYAKTYLTNNKAVRQYSEPGEEGYIIDIHNLDDGSLEKTYTLSDYELPSISLGGWLSFGDKKCYYDNGDLLSDQIIAFDIIGDKICNPKVVFEYGDEDSYSSSELKVAEVINDELITLYTYTDTVVDNYAAVYVYDHNSAKEKWRYEFGSVASTNAFVGKLYSENTKSFCDMIFATIGNKLVLVESNTGKLIHEYTLNGNVSDVYYSKDGIIYALTDNGVELAIPVKGVRKEQFDNEHYIGIYQTRQFLSKPESIAYYNGSYVVVNENSNEAYIYSDVKNEDFVEIYRNAIDSSNSSVIINNTGTFAVVDVYKGLMVHDLENKTTYKLGEYYNISSYDFIQEEYLVVHAYTEEYKHYLHIYDLKTGKETNRVACEYIRSSNRNVVNDKIVVPESEKISFVSIDGEKTEWTPKIKSQSSYREWDEGYINKFDVSKDGRIIALIDYYGETGKRLELFDINTQKTIILDASHRKFNADNQEITNFAWLDSDQIVVCLKDNTILYFDTETGECLGEMKCDMPSVISIFELGEKDVVGALCNDSKVYKLNLKTHKIEKTIDLKNETIKTASSDMGTYMYIPEDNILVINWTRNNKGYFVDLSSFKVRYEIDNYSDYCPTKNIVVTNEYNVAGYYPLYTTEELIGKAKQYVVQ